jgi:hypothetical protein
MRRSPAGTATLVAVPAALLAGALAFWALSSGTGGAPTKPRPQASGPVGVDAPALGERAATVCRALSAALPGAIRDRPRRPVSAGAAQNAAYGDPPIVVSCGVGEPRVPKVAQLLILSGVCWFPEEQGEAQVWTTVDREVPVRVTVPKEYDPAGQWVIDLSPAIVRAVPSNHRPCLITVAPSSPR